MNGVIQQHLTGKMEVVSWLITFLVQPKRFGILKEYMPTHLTYQVKRMNRMHISYFIFHAAHILYALMHSRSKISWFNSPWNNWNCTITGTAQHMEREGKRAWRNRAPKSQTMWGFAFTTVSKPTNNQRLCPWKGMIHWTKKLKQFPMGRKYMVIERVMVMCRLKRALQNGKRLLGRQQEQFQEEKMAEIVTSKIWVEVQRYTFQFS